MTAPGLLADAAPPAGLVPPGICAHAARFDPGSGSLATPLGLLDPDPALSRAVPKRQAERSAGRYCAARAMEALTGAALPVPAGADRAPIWPAGLTGSIAHTDGVAIAVLGRAGDWSGLGVDVERLIPDDQIARYGSEIATPAELAVVAALGPGPGLSLVFSAKEAIYKAIAARAGRVIGFREATCLALGPGTLRLRLAPRLSDALQGVEVLEVRHAMADGLVFTLCTLPARALPPRV